ncbi:hypothetical protein [Azospirillum sp. B4]|uniref:hypothetical protein n=1 Tax=Azospirillum sp. B4 TaxID=95605 RepID=UPI00034C2980|nr:hypothetical protein [Azospirillum sp. B4]
MTFTFDDFKARFFQASPVARPKRPQAAVVQDNPVPNGLGARRVAARAGDVPDHIDGIPIAAILAAIKADPAALHRRRAVLEGEIRTVWANLQELVREYRVLGDEATLPRGMSPSLSATALPKEVAEALGGAMGLPLTVMPTAPRAPAPEAADKGGLFDVEEEEPATVEMEPVRLPRSRTMVRPARRQAR